MILYNFYRIIIIQDGKTPLESRASKFIANFFNLPYVHNDWDEDSEGNFYEEDEDDDDEDTGDDDDDKEDEVNNDDDANKRRRIE